MLIHCPNCNTEYDCEPGKYECECGAKFYVVANGGIILDDSTPDATQNKQNAAPDIDKTIPPRRESIEQESIDATLPGERNRKSDRHFEVGDLILGRYKVLSELGQGGMGVVYKCFDEIAGIEIALKALPPELSHNTLEMEDVKDNFQLVSKLVHQNIAISKNLEKDNSTGNYYLIMECVEGEDLRRWIKRKRRENTLTIETILPVIRQVAAALDYAHDEKIIHRDIKPGNIMIDAEGHVKVLDFGLAAQIHTSMTRVSMAYHGTSGTAPYMAPEQWRGQAQGAAADQYALAVMTYEMLAGHLPFESADISVLREAVLNDTAGVIGGIPKHVQQTLVRGIAKNPDNRFNSCSDFAASLEGIKVPGMKKKSGKGKWIVLAASIAILFLVVGLVWQIQRSKNGISSGLVTPLDSNTTEDVFSTYEGENTSFQITEGSELQQPVETNKSSEQQEPHVDKKSIVSNPGGIREAVHSASNNQLSDPSSEETIVLPGGVEMKMVKVEVGTFEMSVEDGGNSPDEVMHKVTLKQVFYLAKTELTQGQWKAMMGTNPSEFKGDNLPVERVSWNDAMEFCDKMNSTEKAPAGWIFTLPTETQWEYAARGGNRSSGYKYSGSNNVGEIAWYGDNSRSKTHPVGQKKPNELGLYDMSGNVWEWCLDDWQDRSDETIAEFKRGNDQGGANRLLRGGCWVDGSGGCRSSDRNNSYPSTRDHCFGFRPALVPQQ